MIFISDCFPAPNFKYVMFEENTNLLISDRNISELLQQIKKN